MFVNSFLRTRVCSTAESARDGHRESADSTNDHSDSPTQTATPAAVRDEPPTVTKHSISVNGKKLDYTVTTGYMPLKNSQSGETEARMFFMAYTLDNRTGRAAADVFV